MRTGEVIAAVVTAILAVPLVFMFGRAVADGDVRRRESAVRAMLGDDAYEAFQHGDMPPQNYLGNERTAPDFTLRDRHGTAWRLHDRRGKVVVMNFWTVTCGPCVEEMPSLDMLAGMLKDEDDVELVTVSVDSGWNAVSTVLPPRAKLRVLFDPDRSIVTGKYGTRLFPETWIIDKEGVIRVRIDHGYDWSSALARDLINAYR